MHLGHVAINVGDLDPMVSFYVDDLGTEHWPRGHRPAHSGPVGS